LFLNSRAANTENNTMLRVIPTMERLPPCAAESTTDERAQRILERAERNILNRLVEAVLPDCWHRNYLIA